jgi:hypothetical protein
MSSNEDVFSLHISQKGKLITVFAHQPESKTYLAGYPDLNDLIDHYNTYATKLSDLVQRYCDPERRVENQHLYHLLEGELDVFVSKETNKRHAKDVLQPYVLPEKRSEFSQEWEKI